MQHKRFSLFRLYLTILVILIGFGLISSRHLNLAIDQQPFLLEKSHARSERNMVLFAQKGMMTDRDGRPLAISTPYYRLGVNPKKLQISPKDWKKLASVMGVPEKVLKQKIDNAKDKNYVALSTRLGYQQMLGLKDLPLEQLVLEEKKGRYYPLGEKAAQVIGYVGVDGQGKMGLEYQFDNYIDGHDGSMSYTKNLLNQVTSVHDYLPEVSGENLRLTLDARLQTMAYGYLEEAVKHHDADYAACIVSSVKTGEVLAMASYPSFDPNNQLAELNDATKNHTVSDVIEPGSIIKPIALAAVLKHTGHDPGERIDTSGGAYEYQGQTFHDHKDLGEIAFREIFMKSSNIAMVKLTQSLPENLLLNTYRAFGLFSPTYIQLPGESSGRHVDDPNLVDVAAMSYGYGLSVNMLAMVRAYNIIANDGFDPGLHLIFEKHRPNPEEVISKVVARQINDMMVLVTEQGVSSQRAKVANVSVAGKSGTTHHLGKDGEYQKEYVASFAGFAPSEDPEVSIVVVVNKPKKNGHYGGQVAAPLFAKLLRCALTYSPK